MGCICFKFDRLRKDVDTNEAIIDIEKTPEEGNLSNSWSYTFRIDLRDLKTNRIIKSSFGKSIEVYEFKKIVRSLFDDNCISDLVFHGRYLKSGTLEENGIYDCCKVDIIRNTLKIAVRDIRVNKIIKSEYDRSLKISEFKQEVRRLFKNESIDILVFQAKELKTGTLESNGIENDFMVDIIDNSNQYRT